MKAEYIDEIMKISFSQFESILKTALGSTPERQFEDRYALYNKYGKSTATRINNHPWLDNLRDYARMLNRDILIPHATFGIKFNQNTNNLDDFEIGYVGECDICNRAAEAREIYEKKRKDEQSKNSNIDRE